MLDVGLLHLVVHCFETMCCMGVDLGQTQIPSRPPQALIQVPGGVVVVFFYFLVVGPGGDADPGLAPPHHLPPLVGPNGQPYHPVGPNLGPNFPVLPPINPNPPAPPINPPNPNPNPNPPMPPVNPN